MNFNITNPSPIRKIPLFDLSEIDFVSKCPSGGLDNIQSLVVFLCFGMKHLGIGLSVGRSVGNKFQKSLKTSAEAYSCLQVCVFIFVEKDILKYNNTCSSESQS